MAKKEINNTNTVAKKPRGKPFAKGADDRRTAQFTPDDPRRNNNGQRSAAVVAFSRNLRELLVTVGEEVTTLPDGRQISKIEGVVRAAYKQAIDGDHNARSFIAERVEGKIAQKIDLSTLTDDQLLAALATADSSEVEA